MPCGRANNELHQTWYLNESECVWCRFHVQLELCGCCLQGIDIHMLYFHSQHIDLMQAQRVELFGMNAALHNMNRDEG